MVSDMIKFTPLARAKWQEVPEGVKPLILANIWCVKCRSDTTMIDFGGHIDRGDLILEGHCDKCHSKVARLLEGG